MVLTSLRMRGLWVRILPLLGHCCGFSVGPAGITHGGMAGAGNAEKAKAAHTSAIHRSMAGGTKIWPILRGVLILMTRGGTRSRLRSAITFDKLGACAAMLFGALARKVIEGVTQCADSVLNSTTMVALTCSWTCLVKGTGSTIPLFI